MAENVQSDSNYALNDIENPPVKTQKLLGIWGELKLCSQYYRRNLKAFLGIQSVSFILIFLYNISSFLPLDIVDYNGIVLNLRNALELLIPCVLIGSTFGFSYDILSSGDEFAEIKGFLHYFKAHWWRYLAIGVFLIYLNEQIEILMVPIFPLTYPQSLFWFTSHFLSSFIPWIVNVFTVVLYASVTAQGTLRRAALENLSVVRHHLWRLFKTYALLFVLFELPTILLAWGFAIYSAQNFGYFPWWGIANIPDLVEAAILYLVQFPLLALMVTRIYNAEFIQRGGD